MPCCKRSHAKMISSRQMLKIVSSLDLASGITGLFPLWDHCWFCFESCLSKSKIVSLCHLKSFISTNGVEHVSISMPPTSLLSPADPSLPFQLLLSQPPLQMWRPSLTGYLWFSECTNSFGFMSLYLGHQMFPLDHIHLLLISTWPWFN